MPTTTADGIWGLRKLSNAYHGLRSRDEESQGKPSPQGARSDGATTPQGLLAILPNEVQDGLSPLGHGQVPVTASVKAPA